MNVSIFLISLSISPGNAYSRSVSVISALPKGSKLFRHSSKFLRDSRISFKSADTAFSCSPACPDELTDSKCSSSLIVLTLRGISDSSFSPKQAVKEKKLPLPGSLSTVMPLPPMRMTSFWLMARPSPVPPYFLVMEPSAWINVSKRESAVSRGIPIPVSETQNASTASWVCCSVTEILR